MTSSVSSPAAQSALSHSVGTITQETYREFERKAFTISNVSLSVPRSDSQTMDVLKRHIEKKVLGKLPYENPEDFHRALHQMRPIYSKQSLLAGRSFQESTNIVMPIYKGIISEFECVHDLRYITIIAVMKETYETFLPKSNHDVATARAIRSGKSAFKTVEMVAFKGFLTGLDETIEETYFTIMRERISMLKNMRLDSKDKTAFEKKHPKDFEQSVISEAIKTGIVSAREGAFKAVKSALPGSACSAIDDLSASYLNASGAGAGAGAGAVDTATPPLARSTTPPPV